MVNSHREITLDYNNIPEKIVFVCDKCNTEYFTKKEADDCCMSIAIDYEKL